MSTADAEMPDGDADPEVEPDAEPEEDEGPLEDVSLDLFDLVRSSRNAHGLRHGDYLRYRQYCSRRLLRLRRSLKLTHGKGRYKPQPLELRMVRDPKHLMLPLFCCERAWAYAMQVKRENTAQEPRPRFHLLQRLNKAAKWSVVLSKLCAERGDKRTALEAEAYSAFMRGNMHLEREQWKPALDQLKRSRTICTELSRVSVAEQVHLYSQMVEEVEPSIRFCAYNLKREGGSGADAEGAGEEDDFEGLAGADSTSDILRSKLEAVLQESRAKQASTSANELSVAGERVPIRNEKTRIAVLASQRALQEIAALGEVGPHNADDAMPLYDRLFVHFNDALEPVRADLRAATKENTAKSGVAKEHLEKLQAGLMWQKLEHMSNRMLVLIEKMRTKREDGGKRVSPEDIVRLYDSLTNNFSEMGQLVGYREDEGLMTALGARAAVAKAFRCYYVAESYGAAAQWKEANALYRRASTLLEDAAAQVDGSSKEAGHLSQLDALIDGARARAHAQVQRRPPTPTSPTHTHPRAPALPFHPPPPPPHHPCSYHQACILKIVGEPEVAAAGQDVSELSLAHGAHAAPMIDRLDDFHRSNPDALIDFPPKLQTVPCKPLLFDLARNEIAYPDIGDRVKSKTRSWLGGKASSWFGRG